MKTDVLYKLMKQSKGDQWFSPTKATDSLKTAAAMTCVISLKISIKKMQKKNKNLFCYI